MTDRNDTIRNALRDERAETVALIDQLSSRLDAVIEVPARKVMACTFGGDGLDELFITTSREGVEPGEDPLAGALFRAVPGVRGLPVRELAG